MKRTLTITCTQDLSDSEWFRAKFVEALTDYARALAVGETGHLSSETFVTSNGIELRIEHTKETSDGVFAD